MRTKILQRIELLRNAYAFSLEYAVLNTGQRICLSQERAAWLEVLEWIDIDDTVRPKYVIPEHLENKVQEIALSIKKMSWIKPEYEQLY